MPLLLLNSVKGDLAIPYTLKLVSMLCHKKPIIIWMLLVFLAVGSQGQTNTVQEGVIFKKGTNTRISNAEIVNRNKKTRVVSNDFGIFRIVASPGDTLVVSGPGYIAQSAVVSDFKDAIIYLKAAAELQEVQVTDKASGKS